MKRGSPNGLMIGKTVEGRLLRGYSQSIRHCRQRGGDTSAARAANDTGTTLTSLDFLFSPFSPGLPFAPLHRLTRLSKVLHEERFC